MSVDLKEQNPVVSLSSWLESIWKNYVSFMVHVVRLIVGLRPPPPPVVPTFFLLVSFTFLFEDFYYIVWKNIRKSVFVAVQDSCTYAGTKLCLNDHYLCETFCLGWTLHHCNTTPMWGLISLQVLIEHLSHLAWMPTYGTAIRDFRHQTAVYLESLLWYEFSSNCSLPSQCHLRDKVWTPAWLG